MRKNRNQHAARHTTVHVKARVVFMLNETPISIDLKKLVVSAPLTLKVSAQQGRISFPSLVSQAIRELSFMNRQFSDAITMAMRMSVAKMLQIAQASDVRVNAKVWGEEKSGFLVGVDISPFPTILTELKMNLNGEVKGLPKALRSELQESEHIRAVANTVFDQDPIQTFQAFSLMPPKKRRPQRKF